MALIPNLVELKRLCTNIRLDVLNAVESAQSGHIDSSFSVVEVLVAIYFVVGRFFPDAPTDPRRDRVVMSKGHAAPALYSVLARRGFFPLESLQSLRQLGSPLQGHPRPGLPGIEVSTGSLGQGLSMAAGMAYASLRLIQQTPFKVYAIISDGELNEGQTWEALIYAAHQGLSNLTVVIDANGLQFTGTTKEVLEIRDLPRVLSTIGWDVYDVDGHDLPAIVTRLSARTDRPRAIIARTIKGKGVAFLENRVEWHGKVPTRELVADARSELLRGS